MKEISIRRLMPLLLLLSITTGIVDAVSVLGLGKVFTANMTGNVVFLGLAFAGTPSFTVAPSLLALVLFLVGAAAAGHIHKVTGPARLRRWAIVCAVLEAALLTAAAAIAAGYNLGILSETIGRYATIAVMALAMGLRNATMRKLHAPDVTTTALTTVLTDIGGESSLAGGANPNLRGRLAPVIAILAGAAIGALMVMHVGVVAPLLLAASLAVIGLLTVLLRPPDQPSVEGAPGAICPQIVD